MTTVVETKRRRRPRKKAGKKRRQKRERERTRGLFCTGEKSIIIIIARGIYPQRIIISSSVVEEKERRETKREKRERERTRGEKRMTHPVNAKTINQNVISAEYAVRGPIVIRAGELEEQLEKDPSSVPFDDIVLCNIGNPQSLGQKPITFFRQIMAICDYPDLLESPKRRRSSRKTSWRDRETC